MRILVTGATGGLGSELLPLLKGHAVFALSRRPGPETPGVEWLTGDVNFQIPEIKDLDAVLHMAALTGLKRKAGFETVQTNLQGTRRMLAYARTHNAAFYHVSTLYVSGDHTGIYTEGDFDVGQGFRNSYEESKFQAEKAVRESGLDYTIFRPGILVGRHRDGYTKSFNGFYQPVHAIVACHEFAENKLKFPPRHKFEDAFGLPRLHLPIKIHGDPDSTLALVPTDYAASFIARVIAFKKPATYHIASSAPRNEVIVAAVRDALMFTGVEFSKTPSHGPLDSLYNRMVRDFTPYLANAPIFSDYPGYPCPPVDYDFIKRIVTFWRENNGRTWGPEADRRPATV